MLVSAFDQYHLSPLGLTLKWQEQQDIAQSLQLIAHEHPEAIGVIEVEDVEPANMGKNEAVSPTVEVPTFKGRIERDWWLSSFTALSRNLRHAGMSIPDRDLDIINESSQGKSITHPDMRFMLAKGANAGNLLHDIFEYTDFSQSNWQESLDRYFDKYPDILKPWRLSELTAWLEEIIEAPLVGEVCFRDLNRHHMLHEAEFYFPMSAVKTHQLTDLLIEHRQRHRQADENFSLVQLPQYQQLKGMMHGFIDLIFEHDGRYYVCDYKSTYLGDDYQNYQYQTMLENNEKHYYDLQYLIYSLALHRQLKQSVTDYQPERHFGGVYYCYLRGMNHKSSVKKAGVFYRKIAVEELDRLDQTFSGEPSNQYDS